MNEKVLGCLSWGLSRSWSLCSVEPESVRSKHISLLLHAHPNQAYLFMLIKVKDSLRIKRPQVRILPSAPPKDTDIDTMSVFFLFAVSSVEDANIG